MLRRDWSLAIACGTAIVLLVGIYSRARRDPQVPRGPRAVRQVARLADSLGLHHRSDILSGEVASRLVVSDRPLTYTRANTLHMGDPHHACWRGTVAVCGEGRVFAHMCDGQHGILWGDVLLYGDPALIRQLITSPLPDDVAIDEPEAPSRPKP